MAFHLLGNFNLFDRLFGDVDHWGLLESGLVAIGAGGVLASSGHGATGFAEAAAGSAEHFAGGAARATAAGEGIFARFVGLVHNLTDLGIYADFFQRQAGVFNQTAEQLQGNVEQVVAAHVTLREQLKQFQGNIKIAPLLKEYEALGSKLPSEALTQRVYDALKLVTHPDRLTGSKEMHAALESATKDIMQNDTLRRVYEAAHSFDASGIEKAMEEAASHVDFTKAAGAATKAAAASGTALQLTGPAESIKSAENAENMFTRANKWVAGLSKGQKVGLVAGVAATAAVGGIVAANLYERSHRKKLAKDDPKALEQPTHQERFERNQKEQKVTARAV